MMIRGVPAPAGDYILLLARVLLATIFIVFGWNKLMDVAGTTGYMQSLGVPVPQLAAYVAVAVELGAGALVIAGFWTRPMAVLLAVYALAAGCIGHPFWLADGEQRYSDTINFYKNLCICGGFLLLYVTGPGHIAFDARRGKG